MTGALDLDRLGALARRSTMSWAVVGTAITSPSGRTTGTAPTVHRCSNGCYAATR